MTNLNINNSILEVIIGLFVAQGPQSFSEILHEVRTQCSAVNNLGDAHPKVKSHLHYLLGLGSVIEQNDEFGIVYGRPGDF